MIIGTDLDGEFSPSYFKVYEPKSKKEETEPSVIEALL